MGKEQEIRDYWQKFYQDNFGIQVDLSRLEIPKPQGDFTWCIITLREVTEQMIYEKCEKLFPCWSWTSRPLEETIKSDRTSKETYIGLFRNRVEPDEELKKISANKLEEKNILGVTLKQRLIMGLEYFLRTGKHLDNRFSTLCTGSHYVNAPDGSSPDVNWNLWCGDEQMEVNYRCTSEYAYSDRFSRQQFSL